MQFFFKNRSQPPRDVDAQTPAATSKTADRTPSPAPAALSSAASKDAIQPLQARSAQVQPPSVPQGVLAPTASTLAQPFVPQHGAPPALAMPVDDIDESADASDTESFTYESDYSDGGSILSIAASNASYGTGFPADSVVASLRDEVFLANCLEGSENRLRQHGRCVSIALPLLEMNPLLRQSVQLTAALPLTLTLDMEAGCGRKSPLPKVTVSYGAPDDLLFRSTSEQSTSHFIVGLQLTQAVQKLLGRTWQIRDESFWQQVCTLADQRLLNAGDNCMLCDEKLTYPGFKPTVCEAPLCCYQMDSLGIGASLKPLEETPEVADFLILATAAAALGAVGRSGGSAARPGCLPTTPSRRAGEPMTLVELTESLQNLPNMDILTQAAINDGKPWAAGKRIEAPKSENRAAEASGSVVQRTTEESFELGRTEDKRILSWIFATNRAHLTYLGADERIEAIRARHQFKIHTSTRKHAQAFEALKAAHGSFYAFHGSPLNNWHNILRNNLQNLSGTAMMSTGAAYGNGIYLAERSGISMQYSQSRQYLQSSDPGWAGSTFGSDPQVLALCEVANTPTLTRGRGTGIIVAPDAACVTLRYLFIYDSSSPVDASIEASSLQLQRYRNETTIASMEPIAELPPERLLVTSDQYAWDIEELVSMVQAKNGLFINSYTQQSFAPSDVRAILDHRSGAGQILREMELENAALRRQVAPTTLAYLRKIGRICKYDQSADFGPSNAALAQLQTFLTALPNHERQAMRRAPFAATDSLTGEPMRDTIDNAVTLALSASACIHKFGDFLLQLA